MSSRGRGKRNKSDDDGWGVWGGYMAAKVQKLTNQVKDIQQGSKSKIFKDISIFVNGYTKPTAADLKQLILEHGGVFHHYYRRELVSHTIASNLPNSKMANLNEKKVCRPEWITDSIDAGRLLPYEDYLLYTARSKVQPGLAFRAKSKVMGHTSTEESCGDIKSAVDDVNDKREVAATSVVGTIDDFQKNEHYTGKDDDKCEDDLDSHTDITADQEVPELPGVVALEEMEPPRAETESLVKIPQPRRTDTFRSPSKAGDANFLSEFYTHSRLHHLSTWGAEFKEYVNQLQQQGDANTYRARERLRQIAHRPHAGDDSVGKAGRLSLARGRIAPTSDSCLQRVILHIDMDCFFVSVGLRNKPELVGKPIAVTHSRGKGVSKDRPGADLSYERAYYQNKGLNKKKPSSRTTNHGPGPDEDFTEPDENDLIQTERLSDFPTEQQTFYSMAEIASCSYEARNAGVKNGMFMGTAKQLCPDIITIPYDFDGYNEVSRVLYDTVAGYTHDIEAVSCDEMLVDCTDILADTGATPQQFAALLREEIREKTKCNASVGMGPSILIARLATRVAKPNGLHHVSLGEVTDFIKDKSLRDLPGVGRTVRNRLQNLGIATCGDMQAISLDTLRKEMGPKTGQSLYDFCRGIDKRPIKMEKERKSVSAEINYGIRFTRFEEAEKFITGLAQEVSSRLQKIEVKGKTITLKVKVRKKDAPKETAKFLGHGVCDNMAKSTTVAMATDNQKVIANEAISLVHALKIAAEDLRGIGIQMSRLESLIGTKAKANTRSILQFTSTIPPVKADNKSTVKQAEAENRDIDSSVQIGAEENGDETEKNKYADFDGKQAKYSSPVLPPLPTLPPDLSSPETSFSELMSGEKPSVDISEATRPVRHTAESTDDFMLPSPSQVDPAVLQELPPDIRRQIEMALNRKAKMLVADSSKSLDDDTHISQKAGCSHWSSQLATSLEADQSEETIEDGVQTNVEAIVALPNISQLDPSCMAALPAEIRHEIEKAYADCPEDDNNQSDSTKQTHPLNKSHSAKQTHPLMKFQASPMKSPGKSPKKSPAKSPRSGKKQSPVFKVPRGKPPGTNTKKLSPKKLEFGNRSRIRRNVREVPQISTKMIEKASVVDDESRPCTVRPSVTVSREKPPVSLCGAVTLTEVKALMKEWITSSPSPEEEDLAQFVQYVAELVLDRNLEQVHLLVKYLNRLLVHNMSSRWQHGAEFILQQTQGIVRARHGRL